MDLIQKFCETGDMNALSKIDDELATFALDQVPDVLEIYPHRDIIYNKRALKILELFDKAPPHGDNEDLNINGLYNVGASCYLDSVLVCLFAIPTEFVNDNILNATLKVKQGPMFDCAPNRSNDLVEKQYTDLENREDVQKQLRSIADSITGDGKVKRCTNLRKSLRKCPVSEDYHLHGEKDAGEFLGYILNMFDTNLAYKRITSLFTHELGDNPKKVVKSVVEDKNASIVQFVHGSWLSSMNQKNSYYMSEFLAETRDDVFDDLYYHKGNGYERRIVTEELISTPYLIFNVQRKYLSSRTGREIFLRTRIIPSETLSIYNGSRFQLIGVVVYTSHHYMAYFKYGYDWYFYDDMGGHVELVGEYEDLLKQKPSPITQGTIYYYNPIF